MANFKAELEFIDLKTGPAAPALTDLLFFNFEARHDYQTQHYTRGWVGEDGHLFLIGAGGKWEPTHYAHVPDFYASAQVAEEQAAGSEKRAQTQK